MRRMKVRDHRGLDARATSCRAALGWLAHPARESGRLSRYRFTDRFTMWDNTMNQMYRFSQGLRPRGAHRELARLGLSGIEVNRYPDPGGWHVRNRRFPADPYPWLYELRARARRVRREFAHRGHLRRRRELRANRDDLLDAVQLARRYGLQPGFVCYEPRGTSEAILRSLSRAGGSRIDHPGRSLQPRYALDIATRACSTTTPNR